MCLSTHARILHLLSTVPPEPSCTQQLRHSHPPLHLTFWEGSPPTAQTSSKGSGRGRPGRFEVTDLGQAPHPGPFSTSHFPYRSTPALRPPSASNSTARGHAPPPAQLEASGQRAARRTVNGRRDARAAESTASTLSIKIAIYSNLISIYGNLTQFMKKTFCCLIWDLGGSR